MTLHRPFAFAVTALALSFAAASAHADGVYGNLGLPGAMLGYSHSANSSLGLRVDASTLGTINRDFTESGIDYKGKVKANRLGLFADYFPMQGGFRLTGGVTFNDIKANLSSKFDGTRSVTIGNRTITPTAGDYIDAEVKFPRTTPYVGIGWGHQAGPQGFGFVADLGVMIGKARVTTRQNLVANHPGIVRQSDVDTETQKLQDGVGDVKVFPQISVGVNYRY